MLKNKPLLSAKLAKAFDIASLVLLLLSTLAVPLFLDKNLANFYILPKQYAFIALILLNILVFATKSIFSKKIVFKYSVLDVPILVFLLVAIISSLLSVSISNSFLGRSEYFTVSFVFLLFLAIFYFLVVNYFNTKVRWRGVLDLLLLAGVISQILFFVKAVFKISLPLVGDVFNVVEMSNSAFGLWTIAMFVISAGLLIKKDAAVGRALAHFVAMVLCLAVLLVIGFPILWWLLLAGLILLLLLGVSFIQEARIWWLSILFALLILVAVFGIFGSPQSLQAGLPAEVSLSWKSSWSITSGTIFSGVKNFLLGSGLGSFGVDFSKFRPADFNYNNLAWSLRFNQPLNSLLALLSEGGFALLLVVVFIILFVLGHVFQSWNRFRNVGKKRVLTSIGIAEQSEFKMEVFLLVAVWLIMLGGMAFIFYGPALWWLWWLVLGLIITGLHLLGHENVVKEKQWALEDTPQYNLAFSFALIVVMAVVIIVGIIGVRVYWAERVYASALQTNDYKIMENKISRAISLFGSYDIYHVALARVYLLQAMQLSQNQPQSQITAISQLVANAVSQARQATDLSPNQAMTWENLTTMYENAAVLVPGARDWAVKSLEKAVELEPTNAVFYWRLGNNYSLSNNAEKAIEMYKKSIELKSDYVGAYISLANVYEQGKKIDEAIEQYKTILPAILNNPEALFNYGRLLYNRRQKDDVANAEQLWLEAERLQSNYSNALYSLGLLYENKGDRSKALEYYYKVKDLNPDNNQIVAKIKSLIGEPEPKEEKKK